MQNCISNSHLLFGNIPLTGFNYKNTLVKTNRTYCTNSNVKPEINSLSKIPMTVPFPNVIKFNTTNDLTSKPIVKISKLDNGIRVVTQDKLLLPGSAVGMMVRAGTRFESSKYKGYSWLSEKMSVKSSKKYPLSSSLSFIDTHSTNLFALSLKEEILVNCEVINHFVPKFIDILYDTTFNMLLVEEEFNEQLSLMKKTLFMKLNSFEYLIEELHRVAYGEEGLGNGKLSIEENSITKLSFNTLQEYRIEFFLPQKIVLAGIGVNHDQFVDDVNNSFGQLQNNNINNNNNNLLNNDINEKKDKMNDKKNKSNFFARYSEKIFKNITNDSPYKGGEFAIIDRRKDMKQYYLPHERYYATILLAFEAPNYSNRRANCALILLCALLGSGSSFSSGGPGKGMHSRSYKTILSKSFVDSVNTFHFPYSDTGLFGISISGKQEYASTMVDIAISSLCNLVSIEKEEFERARNQAKSSLFTSYEERAMALFELQKQVLDFDSYADVETYASILNDLTIGEVQEIVVNMLTSKQPSLLVFAEEKYCKRIKSSFAIHSYCLEIFGFKW